MKEMIFGAILAQGLRSTEDQKLKAPVPPTLKEDHLLTLELEMRGVRG